jgi:hypothetical protein
VSILDFDWRWEGPAVWDRRAIVTDEGAFPTGVLSVEASPQYGGDERVCGHDASLDVHPDAERLLLLAPRLLRAARAVVAGGPLGELAEVVRLIDDETNE